VETATQERTTRPFEPATTPNGDPAPFSIGGAHQLIGPLAELSMVAARENTRLAAELQIAALETLRESQSTAMHLYHRGFLETLDSIQRALTFVGTSARLVMQVADRLQMTTAMEAGRRIREAMEQNSGRSDTTRR
jgi:hypothetical protein